MNLPTFYGLHVEITTLTVLELMSFMNNYAAVGPNSFSGYFWFCIRSSSRVLLSIIYNKLLVTGKTLNKWKKPVVIIPI